MTQLVNPFQTLPQLEAWIALEIRLAMQQEAFKRGGAIERAAIAQVRAARIGLMLQGQQQEALVSVSQEAIDNATQYIMSKGD
jgi:hypothetical protein